MTGPQWPPPRPPRTGGCERCRTYQVPADLYCRDCGYGDDQGATAYEQGGIDLETVQAVSRSARHTFSKPPVESIRLLAGLGVEGDAHMGVTVRHRSRVRVDPSEPNLRQVHLIHEELLDELNGGDVAHP